MKTLAAVMHENEFFDQSDASSQFFLQFMFCASLFSAASFDQSDASSQFFVRPLETNSSMIGLK